MSSFGTCVGAKDGRLAYMTPLLHEWMPRVRATKPLPNIMNPTFERDVHDNPFWDALGAKTTDSPVVLSTELRRSHIRDALPYR